MREFLVCMSLCLGTTAIAQDPPPTQPPEPEKPLVHRELAALSITGELTVQPFKFARLKANGDLQGKTLLWDIVPEEKVDAEEHGSQLWFIGPPGTYRVKLRAIANGKVEIQRAVVTFEGPPAEVKPVEAVKPPVEKFPPAPPPPIPEEGNRVLIVVEREDTADLTPAQKAIISSPEIRNYLDTHCAMGPQYREWRIWHSLLNVEGERQVWRDVMARQRNTLPWIVISTGKTGYEGVLPQDVPRTLNLLRKYFGP